MMNKNEILALAKNNGLPSDNEQAILSFALAVGKLALKEFEEFAAKREERRWDYDGVDFIFDEIQWNEIEWAAKQYAENELKIKYEVMK